MRQDTYRRIVSGEKHSWWLPALRLVLGLLSWFYSFGIRIRNIFYDIKLFRIYSSTVPVICIGNITTGGTGKTPLVIWMCNYLKNRGIKCGVLTRGYKTRPGSITDEPALLARACEDATVVVNPDRIEGAKKAVNIHGTKVLVMDDGFQHRRLARNLDFVVVDATCPFGYDRVIPAGLLREPKKSLARASAVIITRADQVDTSKLETEIRQFVPNVPIAKTIHKITGVSCNRNQMVGPDEFQDKSVFAFCGIGNPDAFFESLKKYSINLVGSQAFDDHHVYSVDDIEDISEQAAACGAEMILCTQKDWVKSALLLPNNKNGPTLGYITMELDFIDGRDTICSMIDNLIEQNSTSKDKK